MQRCHGVDSGWQDSEKHDAFNKVNRWIIGPESIIPKRGSPPEGCILSVMLSTRDANSGLRHPPANSVKY